MMLSANQSVPCTQRAASCSLSLQRTFGKHRSQAVVKGNAHLAKEILVARQNNAELKKQVARLK